MTTTTTTSSAAAVLAAALTAAAEYCAACESASAASSVFGVPLNVHTLFVARVGAAGVLLAGAVIAALRW